MIIGIDGNEANVDERVGVHQYAKEILWGLFKHQKDSATERTFVIFLKAIPKKDLPPENVFWRYRIIPGKGLWILTKLMPRLLFKEKPDVFFAPSHYLPFFARSPMVCTIHDLGYLNFTGQFEKYDFWQLKVWSAISIFISNHIICVSDATRKDIVRHYKFASDKLSVVHHGYDKKVFNTNISSTLVRRVVKKYNIAGDYILFLSTLKPSKNIEGLLEAFHSIKPHFSGSLKLVIAGKKGWLYKNIFKKVKELSMEDSVIFTDYISEEDKAPLIRGARVFVLPSFWEGFGMDVLNAMGCGTPVVVSRVASLPEVAGSVGVYVDPYNSQSIANGILEVLERDALDYNKLSKACLSQSAKFSWEKAAVETLNVLEKAAGNR